MEEIETRGIGGLTLEELEAHSRAELLPERIEMRHCYWRRGRRRCRPYWYHTATATVGPYFFGGTTATATATAGATATATAGATTTALAATGGSALPPSAAVGAAAGLIASGLAALRLVRHRDAS
jgi:hypothetical protein